MHQGTGIAPHPKDAAVLDRWRVGIIAFRDTMREGQSHHECHLAGVAAMQAAFPNMLDAGTQLTEAIGWVTHSMNERVNLGVCAEQPGED